MIQETRHDTTQDPHSFRTKMFVCWMCPPMFLGVFKGTSPERMEEYLQA